MRKSILLFLIIISFASISFAQKADSTKLSYINLGGEIINPIGDLGNKSGMGIGLSAQYEYTVSPNFLLTASAGYISFARKSLNLGSFGTFEYDYSVIPVFGGAKLFITEKKDFYVFGQIGFQVYSLTLRVTNASTKQVAESSETNFKLGAGFGAGYNYPISSTISLDVNAKYLYSAGDTSYLGIRGGLRFCL